MAHTVETALMIRTRLSRFTATALVLLVSFCSGPTGNLTAVNRDAASRCVQNIDAWKQAVTRLDVLQQEFDSVSGQRGQPRRLFAAGLRAQFEPKMEKLKSDSSRFAPISPYPDSRPYEGKAGG